MKPFLEHVVAPRDSSWVLYDRRLPSIPFEWHYNSEYELTLTLHSQGQRFVGDNISAYDHGDLVLIGPKVPHTWCSHASVPQGQMQQALVLWFSDAFVKGLIEPHVELRPVRKLLDKSARALAFSPGIRRQARDLICAMLDQAPAERLLGLLRVLLLLAGDPDADYLSSASSQSLPLPVAAEERIGRITSYLHEHYREEIPCARLLRVAALSRSSLHRLFKLQTRMTVSAYVAQLRVGHACALLLNSDKPISCIADEVGYGNLAHFNRQFKELRQQTPREFRAAFQQQAMRRG